MGDEECNAQDAISFIIPSEVLSRGGWTGVGVETSFVSGVEREIKWA